jgi:hypothetical protein
MSGESKPEAATQGALPESNTPAELLLREDLGRDEKIALLRQWELDLREAMVAEEENMGSDEAGTVSLDEVLEALRSLGAESQFHDVTTKHG